MNISTNPLRTGLALFAIGTLLLTGCKKDPVEINPTGTTTASTGYVDNWILANMRYAYYWADKIPARPDTTLAPDDFFDSILYKYNATTNPQGDRFSWIQESSADLTALLNGQTTTTGMEFDLLLRAQNSTDVVGVVIYVLPGSPADKAGFKRNDVFYSVNGTALNTTNAGIAYGSGTLTFGLATVQNGALTNTTTTRVVTPVVFQENPVFKDSVYTIGDRKIGYLMYNQFVPGPNGSTTRTYDNQVNAVFGKFKTQGVNELVLDLRYNGGGDVQSSANLASLIVKGVNGQARVPFVRMEFNPQLTADILNDPQGGTDYFYDYFSNPANNIGSQLSRLYVLTTDRTASASELIINGLRPFMTVNTVGSTTEGKNVGSFTITDKQNASNLWGLQPIAFRSYNKNNESDYWTGFTPTVSVDEPYGALYPLGDTRDALLAGAISHIRGLTTGGRIGRVNQQTVVGSSLTRKPGGSVIKLPQTITQKLVN